MDDNKNTEGNVFMNPGITSRRQYIVPVGIFAVLIVLAVLIYVLTSGSKTAFSINGTNYSLSSYNATLSQAEQAGVSKTIAKNEIAAYRKDQFVANELKMSIPNSLIQTEAQSLYLQSNYSNLNSWQYLASWDSAFHQQLNIQSTGGYEGYIFYFPFNELFVNPFPGGKSPIPGFGNPAAITAAQQYAQTQAMTYMSELSSGHNPNDLLNKVLADDKLKFVGSNNLSNAFLINTNGVSQMTSQGSNSVPDYELTDIKNLGKTGITTVTTLTSTYTSNSTSTGVTTPVPIAYYFIDLQKVISSQPNLQNTVDKSLKALKVKTNV
jgi:hypothetical protein